MGSWLVVAQGWSWRLYVVAIVIISANVCDTIEDMPFFFKALTALFTIVDPIGLVPVVLALTAGMMVGDYVLSFNEQTRELREPFSLSKVFRTMWDCLPGVYDNTLKNKGTNQDVRSFIAERHHTDLLLLRLPVPITQSATNRDPLIAWREEWLRGGDDFWVDFERERGAKLGSRVQSKQQYLGFVEDLLRTAAHIPAWAIAHTENGFISSEELVENISKVRKVEAVYTKDFSDLLGVRASVVVPTS